MNELTPLPDRWMKAAAAAVRGLSWLLLVVTLLLALAWGALHGWIVPRIGDFRPRLEIWATQALGVPVRIGALSARRDAWMPSFELRDVVLLDPQGREALHLARVEAGLTLRSLLNLGFDPLTVEAPELDIRRTAQGRWLVAGLDVGGGRTGGDSPAADWFFAQKSFVIRHGTVRWTDELMGAPTLALADVELVMSNGVRRHEMRLDATPPAGWGARFTLLGQFRRPLLSRHAGRWTDWSGELFGDFPRVDVSQLRRHTRLGIDVAEGQGAVRLWADLEKGRFVGGAADLALSHVTATLGPKLAPLALRDVTGRLGGRRRAEGFEVYTEGLRFHTREGLAWPGGNVRLVYDGPRGRATGRGQLRADRLDLAALRQIADRLPLGEAVHARLRAHAASGLVETLQASWQGAWPAVDGYQLRGRVAGLAVAGVPAPAKPVGESARPVPGVPGVRGATIDFDLTETGGHASVAITHGALEFPGVFEEPLIPLDRLSADVRWQRQGEGLAVQLASLKLANADAEGEFRASWQTSDPARAGRGSRFPGVLDLQGSFSRAEGARVHRYLPQVLKPEVRHYVRDAVQTGQATGFAVRIRGELNELPFADPRQGEFRFAGRVQGVTLAYVPRSLQGPDDRPWPALTELGGELVFDRRSMRVTGAQARVAGLPALNIPRVEARIDDLAHTTVEVTGELQGPLADALAVVNGSPLGGLMGQALGQARASGDASCGLRLSLPIAELRQSKVQGRLTLAGNELQITPQTPVLRQARGVLSFSETGLAMAGGQARLLGGEARIDGSLRLSGAATEPAPTLRVQGTATAEGLRQARELGAVADLAQRATGSTPYTAELGLRHGVPELTVSSSLQGLALSLPAPLSKGADASMPLRLRRTALDAGAMDQWQIALGRQVSVVYQRDLSGAQARVVRGAIGVGLAPEEAPTLPSAGVAAHLDLPALDVDAWQAALAPPGPAAAGPAASAADDAAADAVLQYLPTLVALRARALTLQGRTLHDVVVGGSREGRWWRANLDAQELNGYLEYRQPDSGSPGGIYARLARLVIAPSAAPEVEAMLEEPPAALPALDIVVNDFELRGKKLGRVEIEALNRGAGATGDDHAREWQLNKLNLIMPEGRLSASGLWAVDPRQQAGRRRTQLQFRFDVGDAGALLARLGMPDVVRRGKGHLEGVLAWSGSPLALHYPSLSGQFHADLASGQFLKADPGLAKLLGVLSLQALPRRLTLDFRDVFSTGFAFDFIRGDATVAGGVVSTNNLQMKGVNAAVLMEGRADLARETQDLNVVVVPELDAGTASLVAGVINPAIGLGTYLAQQFLLRPLAQANTQQFHIDGTWTDPRVTKVPLTPAADRPKEPAR